MKDLPDVDKPRAGIPGAVKVLLGCGLVAVLFGVLICGGAAMPAIDAPPAPANCSCALSVTVPALVSKK